MKRVIMLLVGIAVFMSFPLTAISRDGDTYISDAAMAACVECGERYGICPELLMALIERESRGQPDVENGSCKGLCQISVKWHKDRMERLDVTDIFDEYGNILVATDYLAELFEKYHEAATVLMVYHGEKNAVEKAESGEISNYAQSILERSAFLEELHGK